MTIPFVPSDLQDQPNWQAFRQQERTDILCVMLWLGVPQPMRRLWRCLQTGKQKGQLSNGVFVGVEIGTGSINTSSIPFNGGSGYFFTNKIHNVWFSIVNKVAYQMCSRRKFLQGCNSYSLPIFRLIYWNDRDHGCFARLFWFIKPIHIMKFHESKK